MFQDKMEDQDRLSLEGYLAHKWGLEDSLPNDHLFKNESPKGPQGATITGIPTKAGNFPVTLKATNLWDVDENTFSILVSPAIPRALTLGATEVASTGARLNGNLHDSGGESVTVSFDWGLSDTGLDNNVTLSGSLESGAFSHFLPNLNSNTTYYYRAKANNGAGTANGNDVSALPLFHWKLDDEGATAVDQTGLRQGQIAGATSTIDGTRGNVLKFDGDNDYVTFGDVDQMDTAEKFTVSLWFKRDSDITGTYPIATNHEVNNVLIAQSSEAYNDNLEIGTAGSQVEIYIDSGTGATTDTLVSIEAGIQTGQWHHLSLTYGSEMTLYVDGAKINTWTQYIGRLDTSDASPLSLGIARPGDASNVGSWGDFNGSMSDVRIYPAELSALEIGILAGNTGIQSFKTGILPAPPVVQVLPVTDLTDTNATLNFELVSYDGSAPEITVYWGPVERGESEGLWQQHFPLGAMGAGKHSHKIGGLSSGENVYYRVKATSAIASDWSDNAERFRTVSKPDPVALPATDRTEATAVLHGRIESNGGENITINLDPPGVSESLIAHWRFDEGTGSETHDSTGFSPTAQVFGGATWTPGMGGAFGTALDFDGSNQAYVRAGSMRISGATSFTAWVYKRNLGNWQRVIDFGNGPNNNNLLVANEGTTSRGIWSIRQGGNQRLLRVYDFWTLNEWQHVTATVNSQGVMRLYRNGQMLGTSNGHVPTNDTRTNQYIGKSNWGDALFDGMMDDIRVYDRDLTEQEASHIYLGDLETTVTLGGDDPFVQIFWGDEDAGFTTDVNASDASKWDTVVDLGIREVGDFALPVTGMTAGKTYYYRVRAQNAAGEVWSPQATAFNTGLFEFTANSLPHQELILWLDASDVDGDGNASNEPFGGSLNFWHDKSGQGHHAGNGNGPEIASGRWNGKTIAKFNGIDQYLRVANSEPFNFGEKATLFLVTKGDTIANWRPIISKRGEDSVGWQFRKPNNDYATFTIRGTTGPDGPYGGTKINGETHIWAVRRDGFKRTQWADGNQEFNHDDRGPVPATDDDVVIGARDQDGIGSYAGVEIGEVLFFRSDLTNQEVAMVEGYLAHKWGLSEQLSGTHPHKDAPPSFENRPGILNKSEISLLKDNPFSLQIIADRSADSYLGSGLPSGLAINPVSGLISGTPTTEGTYGVTIHASNAAGSRPSNLTLHVKDYSRWEYTVPITFPGYEGNETLTDFPVYLEIAPEIDSFSYEQFASPAGFDIRFVGSDGAEELKYEPVEWNPTGVSSFWVRVSELNASTTISAKWGNPEALTQPAYCLNGSIWNRYHAVWHMEGDDPTVIRESRGSLHGTATNFVETPRVPGVIGKALSFDGVNDYVNLPIEAHPPADAKQLTISFWTYGGASLPKNTRILESGSSLGVHLRTYLPYSDGRIIWDAGSGSVDRIEKNDFNYRGEWVHWTLQKESSIGAMFIYKNGEEWMSGYSRTRPFGGPVDNFRLGSGRTGGNYWNGWLDEVRISLEMESPDSIKASYSSQTEADFVAIGSVEGPPTLLQGQVIRGFANDANRSIAFALQTFPSDANFSATGLPAGLSINSSTGLISGIPIQGGSTNITVTAENSKGSDQGIVSLVVVDLNEYSHQAAMTFEGYDGNETLNDFPVLVRLTNEITNFSLRSFHSPAGNDLRFFDDNANELTYEIDEWNENAGELLVWVRLVELTNDLNVTAHWGNALQAEEAPAYAFDGSAWSAGYRGVWHLRAMDTAGVLTDSSPYRNHADDHDGIDRPSGLIGTGRTIGGGTETFLSIPSTSTMDKIQEGDYSFTTWLRLEDPLPPELPNVLQGRGFQMVPNDSYFNNIENLMALTPTGSRIMSKGPGQGFYINGDAAFIASGIGITNVNNYMSLFVGMFKAPETGDYQFRCTDKDDRATIWLDLDQDLTFETAGSSGNEMMGGINNFTSGLIPLVGGQSYKIAIAHGEWGGGSRIRPWIKTPSVNWAIIDPTDPTQDGWFSVPLDGSISADVSGLTIFSPRCSGESCSRGIGETDPPSFH